MISTIISRHLMCHKQYQNGNDHHVQHHDDGVIINHHLLFLIFVENDVLVGFSYGFPMKSPFSHGFSICHHHHRPKRFQGFPVSLPADPAWISRTTRLPPRWSCHSPACRRCHGSGLLKQALRWAFSGFYVAFYMGFMWVFSGFTWCFFGF